MSTLRSLLPSLLLALAAPLAAQTAAPGAASPPAASAPAPGPTDAELTAAQKPSYPLKTCLVSGEALGGMGPPAGRVIKGRYMEFCCSGCVADVEREPAKYLAKLDAAVIAAQRPGYPLTTCPLSGESLGTKPVEAVSGTRMALLCCNDCKAEFLKDPAPSLAKIDAALIAAQLPGYALTTCVVSGEALEDPVDVLYGVQLVRLCCRQCSGELGAQPDKYLALLAAAREPGAKPGAAPADAPRGH